MPGFKRFETAAVTIRGIELAERIKKGQFKTDRLAGRPKRLRRFGLSSLLPNKLSRPAEAHNHVHQKLCTRATAVPNCCTKPLHQTAVLDRLTKPKITARSAFHFI